jgi:hypothetical protein
MRESAEEVWNNDEWGGSRIRIEINHDGAITVYRQTVSSHLVNAVCLSHVLAFHSSLPPLPSTLHPIPSHHKPYNNPTTLQPYLQASNTTLHTYIHTYIHNMHPSCGPPLEK